LLNAKANVGAQESGGRTPLHWAAKDGHHEIVRLLLEAGAEPDRKEDNGMASIHRAAEYGRYRVIELLLAKGADVNSRDNKGKTALHWAAIGGYFGAPGDIDPGKKKEQSGQIISAQFLIQANADVDAITLSGVSALDIAVRCGSTNIAQLLLEAKVDAETKTAESIASVGTL
jgi:cytohesin